MKAGGFKRGLLNKKHRPTNLVQISPEHTAIMWISTKGFSKNAEKRIVKFILRKIKKKLEERLVFVGHCFGRYDLILEFKERSAKVASNLVCDLQKMLVRTIKTPEIPNPICSSLTLSNRISFINKPREPQSYPIRMYTFLRPTKELPNLSDLVKNLDFGMDLFWTTSYYTFLLTTNGLKFSTTLEKMLKFRAKTTRLLKEGCTYVGLNFEENDHKEKDVPIKAYTFVKLRKGFGEIRLDEKKNEKEHWKIPEKRLGWSDTCLISKNKFTLRELKEAILALRENHRGDVITTSTLLALPQKEEKNER